MKILKFNESQEHEMTDYFLELIEDENFTYEPRGSSIRLFYSGKPKDTNNVITKYLTLLKRLEFKYGVVQKSIRIEETSEVQAIEINILLDNVTDFKIEFVVHGRKFTGDVISCRLHSAGTTEIISVIRLNLQNVNYTTNPKTAQLTFNTRYSGPFSKYNCERFFTRVATDIDSRFSIDSENTRKIIDMIKSKNIRFYDTPGLNNILPYIDKINPEDLSDI